MRNPGRLVHLLRNTPVREIIRALERDGFIRNNRARTGGFWYRHPDGRSLPIHYHTGGETLPRKENPCQCNPRHPIGPKRTHGRLGLL